ncbi:MAG: hypothetical protein COU27_01015, partial [Candidatus Levybacteria bacterium CG10_big_fil_rev_8_21_14_0_10_36_7]
MGLEYKKSKKIILAIDSQDKIIITYGNGRILLLEISKRDNEGRPIAVEVKTERKTLATVDRTTIQNGTEHINLNNEEKGSDNSGYPQNGHIEIDKDTIVLRDFSAASTIQYRGDPLNDPDRIQRLEKKSQRYQDHEEQHQINTL